MPTIPRYAPAIDLGARLAALTTRDATAAAATVRQRLGLEGWPHLLPVAAARYGLAACFASLAERDRRRHVVVSAQICPVVPLLLCRLGFRPVLADLDATSPMPGWNEIGVAVEEAGGPGAVAAIVVAPLYGCLAGGIDAMPDGLAGIPIVLDLAQGTLLASQIPGLMARAEAAVFSFGIGKGLDTGGGLLATRGAAVAADATSGGTLAALAGLPAILALRGIMAIGAYRHVIPLLDRRIDSDKADFAAADGATRGHCTPLPAGMLPAIAARLERFAGEVELARSRAVTLHARAAVQHHCTAGVTYGDPRQMHLRQIIRLADADRRDAVVAGLRRRGVDALPAGEPMPEAYLEPAMLAAASAGRPLANARRFLADAVRLPFLGRLDQRSFDRLVQMLEQTLEQRLRP